jgi:hypothetical protein
MFEPTARPGRIAILWRGDEAWRRSASPETSRFKAVFAALADVGVDAEPVVYEDDLRAVKMVVPCRTCARSCGSRRFRSSPASPDRG